MVDLARAIHQAMLAFNERNPGRVAKIDSSLSRILVLDPEWKPRRSDPSADKRPAKEPSIFTIRDIAKRLGTTVGALLGEQGFEISDHDRERASEIVDWMRSTFRLDDRGVETSGNVTPLLNAVTTDSPDESEQTVPRWTPEFPIRPKDFKIRDFDYPRELHAVPVEVMKVAAGVTGVISEINMPQGWLLHDKAVKDTTHRIVRVEGDSMSPDYEEGWLLLVDLRKTAPRPDDLVAVYLHENHDAGEGGVLGWWDQSTGELQLAKANKKYAPVKLGDPATWHVIGTVQKVVDAPAKKRKR